MRPKVVQCIERLYYALGVYKTQMLVDTDTLHGNKKRITQKFIYIYIYKHFTQKSKGAASFWVTSKTGVWLVNSCSPSPRGQQAYQQDQLSLQKKL